MYYPYLRGKQFELIAIREFADRMPNRMVPVIEPVKATLSSLERAIHTLIRHGCQFVIAANPQVGDFSKDATRLHEFLGCDTLGNYEDWSIGCIAHETLDGAALRPIVDMQKSITVIHAGFASGSELARILDETVQPERHIFLENRTSKLYRGHFNYGELVLVRDGFETRRNKDYPDIEHFSDLHVTYPQEGVAGFGDFLIVGDEFSESGGPAYAVAIHITCVDPNEDGDMFVKHFKSDRNATSADPAGKFAEALGKLVADVNSPDTLISHTSAIQEFIALSERGHFPGLGYVKKLSMQHHMELMAGIVA